ncbi:MAG: tetratricopeptide repeat-containing glycosyltransferase family protein [Alphaproteobacteria bacterium]|nr:tetratricopeptide repeat-containing glycosyltransferase family protein [Alphaproteobacteria bacterium]
MNTLSPLSDQARTLFAQGRFAEAEPLFRRIADENPADDVAVYNLGVTLGKLDRFEEAMGCYRATIERNPGFADAYANFGTCLSELGHIAQARQACAIAHQIAPDDPIPVLNEGIAALALGDLTAGWRGFAARWRLPAYAKFKRDFAQPQWRGENLRNKTLFMYAEQGFGDSIQMARYAPFLMDQGARVIIEAQPALAALFRTLPGSPHIIAKGEPVPDFDFYSAMMDVPQAAGTTLDSIPVLSPYLSAPPVALPLRRKPRRVGLCWAGRASHENDRNRSLFFAQIQPLLTRADTDYVSLQFIVPEEDMAAFAASGVIAWNRTTSDFIEAAALIREVDLVITVDTSVAHLAGAMGKPVWILLPFYADWRWLLQREDSPWYPTARLFRQKKRREWDEVIARVAAELDKF